MSVYVAVVKDPFARLEEASVLTGTLEQVLAQLVEMEYVSAEAVSGELAFRDGACSIPSDSGFAEGGLDIVVFEP